MKIFRLYVVGFIFGTLFLAGCNNTAEPEEPGSTPKQQLEEANPVTNMKENNGNKEIKNGVNTVLKSISTLDQEVNARADSAKIQEIGKEISSSWDTIEKQVEDQYPDWYERIEKNLYPLIGESGNPVKNVEKIKQFSKATKADLQSFMEEVNR
ncbi:hypothetical protein ACFRH9_00240 [Peribacillus butanolivorans]|uniref:hypothetical protein n=1 Tax=Peribacillus butanolivorans TaxID=421767 RepID=UPI00366D30AC